MQLSSPGMGPKLKPRDISISVESDPYKSRTRKQKTAKFVELGLLATAVFLLAAISLRPDVQDTVSRSDIDSVELFSSESPR